MTTEEIKKKILFVDDEENILKALKRLLWDHNHIWETTFINDPAEAKQMLYKNSYDAVVLDLKMPRINGLELLDIIKANEATKDIQVIILTGHGDDNLKRQALDMGATDLLNKPINKDDLVARLSNVLQIKAYQDELHNQNRKLQQQLVLSQKMELVGVLSAGVVHDLKNILSIIGGYSQLLAMQMNDNEQVLKPIGKIQDAADRANNIMWQILRFSKPGEQNKTNLNLSEMIDESKVFFKSILPHKIRIKWIRPRNDYFVNMLENQFHQLLMNLVINAGQAIEGEGFVEISLFEEEIHESKLAKDEQNHFGKFVKIIVSDSGMGMDEITLKSLFEPHFTTKVSKGGSGLGLTVVKWIVDDNDGFIDIESAPGKGTTFSIYFPSVERG
ncbi:MAG: response regulator [Candidatus Hatepunaea meridiana]|nr:response regulator [Candidatus Hatepunaea meridiana]